MWYFLVLLVHYQTKMKASMKVNTQTNNHKKLKFFICAAAVIGVTIFVINNVLQEPQDLVYYDNSSTSTTLWKLTQPSDRNIFFLWIRLVCTYTRCIRSAQSSGRFPVQGGSWGIQVMLRSSSFIMCHPCPTGLGGFMKGSFPSVLWYCWLGLLAFKTVSQSQITHTVLVETLNPAHFSRIWSYERLKCLAVKGVERRGQRRRSPRIAKTVRGESITPE